MSRPRETRRLTPALTAALSLTVLLAAAPASKLDLSRSATPVADAARAGELETVRSLLRGGADVNAAQGDGMTALHWAAMANDERMADMLLYAGANVHATTRLGSYTPLLMASRLGNATLVARLLEARADANDATTNGTSALMFAAASGSTEAVRCLLEKDADVNATESFTGRTALMFAAAKGRAQVIDLIVAKGADPMATTEVRDVAELEEKDNVERRKRGQFVFGGGGGQQQRRSQASGQSGGQGQGAGRNESRRTEAGPQASSQQGGAARNQQQPAQAREANTQQGGDQAKGPNFFVKLFSWLPGVGDKKEQPQRRRRVPYGELVGKHGGLTPLHLAARQGHREAVATLLEAGAEINAPSEGDHTSPLLIATINGHFDLAKDLLDRGADPNLASDAGATPLYGVINLQWAPKALYPQPTAHKQQQLSYLDMMDALLQAGAEVDIRLKKKLWYSGYNFDLSGVNEFGATPFWRAAYASDVEAMELLVSYGADPTIPTLTPEGNPIDGIGDEDDDGKPRAETGSPSVTPLAAASGVGYGQGFAANSHRHHPGGMLRAMKYLVEECGADVNAADHDGYTPLHHAASRGDNEAILYLVEHGADVTAVSRKGQTTADMANGPVQRVQPFPETVALLMKLGSANSNKCVSC